MEEFFILIHVNGKLQRYNSYIPHMNLSHTEVPQCVEGVPLFFGNIGDKSIHFFLLAHILDKILPCKCRTKDLYGMFRTKSLSNYRFTINISRLLKLLKNIPENYQKIYIRDNPVAITLEGIEFWIKSGKYDKFINREQGKCSHW
jgi:hypothetical protein